MLVTIGFYPLPLFERFGDASGEPACDRVLGSEFAVICNESASMGSGCPDDCSIDQHT